MLRHFGLLCCLRCTCRTAACLILSILGLFVGRLSAKEQDEEGVATFKRWEQVTLPVRLSAAKSARKFVVCTESTLHYIDRDEVPLNDASFSTRIYPGTGRNELAVSIGRLWLFDQRVQPACTFFCSDGRPSRAYTGVQSAGELGMDVFLDCVLAVDFDSGSLRMTRGASEVAIRPKSRIDLDVVHGLPLLKLRIGDRREVVARCSLNLERGVALPEVLCRDLAAFGKYLKQGENVIDLGERQSVGWVSDVLLGSFRMSKTSCVISEDIPMIGRPVLSQFQVVFDFPNKALYLEPGKRFGFPDHSLTFGICLRSEEAGVMVSDVHRDTPAFLGGIQPKDRLLRVNGTDISKKPLAEINSILSYAGHDPVVLELLREGRVHSFRLNDSKVNK